MKLTNDDSIKIKHGKASKNSGGYFYEGPRGQQLYRDRPETYQQKRSPKQRWNSLSFTYAHQQIRQLWSSQEQIDQVTQEWNTAHRIGPNARPYEDPKEWKFVMLQQQWKLDNPFDAWYEAYLQEFAANVAKKTSAENVSNRTLLRQADLLEAQAKSLREQAQKNE